MGDLKWDKSFAKEQACDDPELLAELMTLFRDASIDDLKKIKEGLAANDTEAVAAAAHSIKGAAASLGICGLQSVCFDIEAKGLSGDLADIDLSELEDLIKQLDSLSL